MHYSHSGVQKSKITHTVCVLFVPWAITHNTYRVHLLFVRLFIVFFFKIFPFKGLSMKYLVYISITCFDLEL